MIVSSRRSQRVVSKTSTVVAVCRASVGSKRRAIGAQSASVAFIDAENCEFASLRRAAPMVTKSFSD
jgi:hypothetical protein